MDLLLFMLVVTGYIWGGIPLLGPGGPGSMLAITAAVAVAGGSLWRRGATAREIGIRLDNLAVAGPLYLGSALAYAGIVLLLYRNQLSPPEPAWPGLGRLAWPPFWAFLQQFCYLAFIFRRLREMLRKDLPAIAAAAAIFSLLHLPNPFLTLYTLGGGAIAAALFSRWPNLFAAAVAHALAGSLVSNLLPPVITGGMRVGPLFLRYHAP